MRTSPPPSGHEQGVTCASLPSRRRRRGAARGRPPRIRDDDLLDAARDAFRELGVAATTADIARRAGVSQSILFYRYSTKEALFTALLERELRPPPDVGTLVHTAGQGDLASRLEAVGTTVLGSAQSVQPLLALAQSSLASRKVQELLRSAAAPARIVSGLAAWFRAEQELGRLRPVDPEILARALFGALVDRALAEHAGHLVSTPAKDREFLRGLADLLLAGAAPRERGARSTRP
jgi:AcrR family transcriptional regulator